MSSIAQSLRGLSRTMPNTAKGTPLTGFHVLEPLESRAMLSGTFVSPGDFTNAFPSDARVINVTNWSTDPTKNVIPNDGIDDTARIQFILDTYDNDSDSNPPSKSFIYFPPGVYDVSNTLEASTRPYSRPKLVGHSDDTTIIRLAPNSTGFGAGQTKAVLEIGELSNASFSSYLTDMKFEVGAGNPGAIAVRFIGHNHASVERVKIEAAPNSGYIGLLLGHFPNNSNYKGVGPHLTRDIDITGFDYGVYVKGDGGVGLERFQLTGQRIAGIYADSNQTPIGLHDVTSVQSGNVPAFVDTNNFPAPHAFLSSHFINTSGGGSTPAIRINSTANPKVTSSWILKNVVQSGYGSMLEQNGVTAISAGSVAEQQLTNRHWSGDTSPMTTAFAQTGLTLDLEVKDAPLYINHNFATDYVSAGTGSGNATTDTAAFNAALASGKPVIYMPSNGPATGTNKNVPKLSGSFTIPSHVEAIDFFYQSFENSGNVTFNITGTSADPPLTIRRIEHVGNLGGQAKIVHSGTRTVILESISGIEYEGQNGAGNVFMNNILTKVTFGQGQKAWIRQLDTEGNGTIPFVQVNGAQVWIFNHKSEQDRPIYKVTNGGKLEVYVTKSVNPDAQIVGNPIANWDTRGKWYLDLIDGSASLAAVNTDSGYAAAWPDLIRETRGSTTQTFTTPNPGTGIDGFKYGLITAAAPASGTPVRPTLSNASASGTSITVNYTNVAGETGYTIQYATNPAFTEGLGSTTAAADTTSKVVSGLTSNTTYYFRVLANNSALVSPPSNPLTATTGGVTQPPAAPSSLAATAASSSQINLTWTDNATNEAGFKIERSLTGTSGWSQIATVAANVTSFSNTGLTASTTYHYRVRANNSAGDSAYSNTSNATTQAGSLLADDFNDGNANGWSKTTSPWSVGSYQSRAFALIKTGIGDQTNVVGSSAWTDYSVTSAVNLSNLSGSVGVLARYTNDNNYYELRIGNGGSNWRLIKRVNGTNTTIANGTLPTAYTVNSWVSLRLTVVGNQISAFYAADNVNFVQLGTTNTDNAHSAGQAGLRSAGNTGAFDDFVVA